MNQLGERRSALGQVGRCELALEDRVLQVVAEIPHGLENLAKALVVGDVVADEDRVSHDDRSACRHRRLPQRRAGLQPAVTALPAE